MSLLPPSKGSEPSSEASGLAITPSADHRISVDAVDSSVSAVTGRELDRRAQDNLDRSLSLWEQALRRKKVASWKVQERKMLLQLYGLEIKGKKADLQEKVKAILFPNNSIGGVSSSLSPLNVFCLTSQHCQLETHLP